MALLLAIVDPIGFVINAEKIFFSPEFQVKIHKVGLFIAQA